MNQVPIIPKVLTIEVALTALDEVSIMNFMSAAFADGARQLAEVGRRFDARGWVLGTSGNFSVVAGRDPLRLAITASGLFKGQLTADQILEIDDRCTVLDGPGGKPSAEAQLHLEIVRTRHAGAVLHTHSIWSTMLSDLHWNDRGLTVDGYEMLKGLDGVTTHEHREWIPILDNDQDMTRLGARVRDLLSTDPACHAFLLRRHGMYTWGKTLADAVRHVEILEFLLEAVGRSGEATAGRSATAPMGVPRQSKKRRPEPWPS